MTTPRHTTLAAALAAVQGEMPIVRKSESANTGTYSYKYASLADITATIMPLLAQHGLALSCLPQRGDTGMELVGTLLHESGETITGTLPLAGSTPQQLGSAMTYMRRYLIGTMIGVATDEPDDDGAAASHPSAQRPSAAQLQAQADKIRDGVWAVVSGTEPGSPDRKARLEGAWKAAGQADVLGATVTLTPEWGANTTSATLRSLIKDSLELDPAAAVAERAEAQAVAEHEQAMDRGPLADDQWAGDDK